MILKEQKIGRFLLSAISVCAAILFIIFSSYRSTASTDLSKEKKKGFSSFARLTDNVSLGNIPVTVPSPAVFSKKGHSARTSFTSKFIHLVPQEIFVGRSAFCQAGNSLLNVQQLRLHLVLRVMRI